MSLDQRCRELEREVKALVYERLQDTRRMHDAHKACIEHALRRGDAAVDMAGYRCDHLILATLDALHRLDLGAADALLTEWEAAAQARMDQQLFDQPQSGLLRMVRMPNGALETKVEGGTDCVTVAVGERMMEDRAALREFRGLVETVVMVKAWI